MSGYQSTPGAGPPRSASEIHVSHVFSQRRSPHVSRLELGHKRIGSGTSASGPMTESGLSDAGTRSLVSMSMSMPESHYSPRTRNESFLEELILTSDKPCLYVNLLEARGLSSGKAFGTVDAYACIEYGSNSMYSTTIFRTHDARWEEECTFNIGERQVFLAIRVWNQSLVGKDNLLGEVRIPAWEYSAEQKHDFWFKLERPRGAKYKSMTVSGEIHVRFLYTLGETSGTLIDGGDSKYELLVRSIVSPDFHVLRFLLEYLSQADLIRSRPGERCLHAILIVFQHHTFSSTMRFIDLCIDQEVRSTTVFTSLFRKNTIAPKLLSKFAMSAGGAFLVDMLQPMVENVCNSSKTFEIDELRVTNREDIDKNRDNLMRKCQRVLDHILDTPVPVPIRWVAHSIKRSVEKKFPNAVVNALASLYFLRFVCPAIVAPSHYGIAQQTPNRKQSRFLLLIAKTIQLMANRAQRAEEKDADLFVKEAYMRQMMPFVLKNLDRMRKFLVGMADVQDDPNDVLPSFDPNRAQLDNGLVFLHTYFHTHIDKMMRFYDRRCNASDLESLENVGFLKLGADEEESDVSAAFTFDDASGYLNTSDMKSPSLSREVSANSTGADSPQPSSSATTHTADDEAVKHTKLSALTFMSITDVEHELGTNSPAISTTPRRSKRSPHRMVSIFCSVIDNLGPPPALDMYDRSKTLTASQRSKLAARFSAPDISAEQPEQNRPGFMERLKSRFASPASGSSSPTVDMGLIKEKTRDMQSRYIALLRERNQMLENRDMELSTLNHRYQESMDALTSMRLYVAHLMDVLKANDLPIPPPPATVYPRPVRSSSSSSSPVTGSFRKHNVPDSIAEQSDADATTTDCIPTAPNSVESEHMLATTPLADDRNAFNSISSNPLFGSSVSRHSSLQGDSESHAPNDLAAGSPSQMEEHKDSHDGYLGPPTVRNSAVDTVPDTRDRSNSIIGILQRENLRLSRGHDRVRSEIDELHRTNSTLRAKLQVLQLMAQGHDDIPPYIRRSSSNSSISVGLSSPRPAPDTPRHARSMSQSIAE
jgi:uncharacterized protein (UPF0147 family)